MTTGASPAGRDRADADSLAQQYGKVLLMGEVDWTNAFGGSNLSSWIDRVERSKGVGCVFVRAGLRRQAAA